MPLNPGNGGINSIQRAVMSPPSFSLSLSPPTLSGGIAHHSMPSFTCCSSPLPCICYTSVSSFHPCSSNPLQSGYKSHTWRGRGETALFGSHEVPLLSLELISQIEPQNWRKEKSACIIKLYLLKIN